MTTWRPTPGAPTWVWVEGEWRAAVVEAVAAGSVRVRYVLAGGRATGVTEVPPRRVWAGPRTDPDAMLDATGAELAPGWEQPGLFG